MANFLDATAEIENRLADYGLRLGRIDAHLRRGERRAATAQLHGFLEELILFSKEIELPLETVVVGAQLGFFSGGELLRGRLPGTLIGAAAGWLYGQQVMQRHRLAVEALAEKVAAITIFLERDAAQARTEGLGTPPEPGADPRGTTTEEIEREAPQPTSDRVTLEVDRD